MFIANDKTEVTQSPFFHLYNNYALIAYFKFIVGYIN